MKKLLTALFGFIIFYNVIAYVTPACAAEKKIGQQIEVITVTINNQGTQPLSGQYQAATLKPGMPPLQKPTLPEIQAGVPGNFSVSLIPGTGKSILTYGYDQNNFCQFALSFSGRLEVGAMRHGTAKCRITNSSENSVTINIITLLTDQQRAAAKAAAAKAAAAKAAAQAKAAAAKAAAQAKAVVVAEGVYCYQEMTAFGGVTYTYGLFLDGRFSHTYDSVSGNQWTQPPPCRTLTEMKKGINGQENGSYTLTISTKTIHMTFHTIEYSMEGAVNSTNDIRFRYDTRYDASSGRLQIQTITDNAGMTYQRVQ